jgi:hypothetical protein
LTVYLRLLECAVPALYGDSADAHLLPTGHPAAPPAPER